ncbi:hypothetical protein MKZ38_008002 [Zalerion maritima]|uniref:Exoribonuclease phosphorolytic domain-containing protein n=1 Tax=Zalerion maritima TaxID=339359 RepID=A0AAD5RW55_9PEZI|nr:hypothetical protein MKZ38_008002 [Zalerion maritima]
MADRRRINGPVGVTSPPVYANHTPGKAQKDTVQQRPDNTLRQIFLKTGITPSASGSAYLEVTGPSTNGPSGLKLNCTVHGPRSLAKSTPFTPYTTLTTHVKYAPFATRQRRGYLRDSSEKDLGVHLETALRGVIIADRWPKSGVDIIVTVLEGDQPREVFKGTPDEGIDAMNVLSGCITVASAAIADAGIDCVDMVAGGVAALVASEEDKGEPRFVLDPAPSEHDKILAGCCVAYLPSRDEITNLWYKGQTSGNDTLLYTQLVEKAVQASRGANKVLVDTLKEGVTEAGKQSKGSMEVDR